MYSGHAACSGDETPRSRRPGGLTAYDAPVRPVILARIQGQRLAEKQTGHPTGRCQRGGVCGHFVVQAGAYQVQKLDQPATGDLIEASLPADSRECEAAADPMFDAVLPLAQQCLERLHKAKQIRPIDALMSLQKRCLQAGRIDPVTPFNFRNERFEFRQMVRQRLSPAFGG
jgi:hypothetical protein